MVSDIQFLSKNSGNVSADMAAQLAKVPNTGVQMAIAFVAILPVIVVFPFLQKYYAKGIALGAVKGWFLRMSIVITKPKEYLWC